VSGATVMKAVIEIELGQVQDKAVTMTCRFGKDPWRVVDRSVGLCNLLLPSYATHVRYG
jgi:hypothetical protein